MRHLPPAPLWYKPVTWRLPALPFASLMGLLIASLVVCVIMLLTQPTPHQVTREAFERQHAEQTAALERISAELVRIRQVLEARP